MKRAVLSTGKLSQKEFSSLVNSLLRDWNAAKVTIEDPVLTKLKTKLQNTCDTYSLGVSVVKDTSITKKINEADTLREHNLQVLYELFKVSRYSQVADEQAAYKALYPLLKDAVKMKRSNTEEQSAYINGLLRSLNKTENQAHTKALNLTRAMTNLTTSQSAFETLQQKRNSTKSSETVYNNLELRKELQELYRKINDYLYVMATESDKSGYAKLYKVFATNNNAFKLLVATRKTVNKEIGETTEPPTTPEENVSLTHEGQQ